MQNSKSPFDLKNIRYFIAFRVFFNSRFYYPVFTILFLDFGLTIEQFALLNVAWAATIVALEVPSGAMADVIGRRRLLVLTGTIMVFEIALLCLAPKGNTTLLFYIFLINRILSGTAEAAASGADEALAYDTLKERGDEKDWGRVLEKQMRIQSIAYIGAMSLGAAVYDPALMQKLFDGLGLNIQLSQSITLRFPLYLTFIMALMTLLTTLRLHEPKLSSEQPRELSAGGGRSVYQALKLTLNAGGWILKTPFAMVIILAGLIFDNCIRMVVTLCSQYYRLIGLPEASFGLIGSGFAILGFFNLWIMALISMIGLIGITFFLPIIGLLPVAMLTVVMYMGRFFESHYLNRITASHQRATVLSFKGLSFNLAYGLIGVLYSILLAVLRPQIAASRPELKLIGLENEVFIKSMFWFPWYFLLTLVALLIIARWRLQNTNEHKMPG